MAKISNLACLTTTVLLVLLVVSNGIPKSNACHTFLGECEVPSPCTETSCEACCLSKSGPLHCDGVCELEGTEEHCHCYGQP
ncbi:hypothetical protein N665_0415s0033 [Sinapis alba]|nr:hypothetical protein N665_0415s0033 [Sinapis alba]